MEDRCVICNAIVPEGRQICWICEHKIMEGENDIRTFKRAKDEVSTEE